MILFDDGRSDRCNGAICELYTQNHGRQNPYLAKSSTTIASSWPELPTVRLDATLADRYRRAGPMLADKKTARLQCGIKRFMRLSKDVPRIIQEMRS